MKYDITLKDLFKDSPSALLQELVQSATISFLDTDLPSVTYREADLLIQSGKGLFHIEIQSSNDSTMPYRLWHYYLLIWERYQVAPHQIVLYVGNDPLSMPSSIENRNLSFRYDLLDIRMLNGEKLLNSPHLSDNIFALLCALDQHIDVIQRIVTRISQLNDSQRRRDYLQKLLIVGQLRKVDHLIKEEVKFMPITVDLRENAFYKKALAEAKQEGMEEGIEEGKIEGRLEGKHKLRSIILNLLSKEYDKLTISNMLGLAIEEIEELLHLSN